MRRLALAVAVGVLLGALAAEAGRAVRSRRSTAPRPAGQVLSAGCGSAAAYSGGPTTITGGVVDGDSTARDFDLIAPPAPVNASRPLALVIVYHGAGGNSAESRGYGIQGYGDASKDAVWLFPQGISYLSAGVGWDDNCGGRDMALFDNLVTWASSRFCIDTARVYVAGFSWGCDHVTSLLACRGNRIRAAAPASCSDEFANTSSFTAYNNWPASVSSTAAVRFTHDASGSDSGYASPYFALTSDLYRNLNGCGSATSTTADSSCWAYNSCRTGADYQRCQYAGLGHALPSTWAADTWRFFLAQGLGY